MLDIQPDLVKGLLAQATARGVSLVDYLNEIVRREVELAEVPQPGTGQALIDASAKLRGVLSDSEVDTLFCRAHSLARALDLE